MGDLQQRLKRLAKGKPRRIIVGASLTKRPGWISTEEDELNLIKSEDWENNFKPGSIDAILAEHVWEHLTPKEAIIAAKNCYKYLRKGGYVRVAVPDGFFPNERYMDWVKPGGTGAGAKDHKVLYTYQTFSQLFKSVGFEIKLLEYFDENGRFHLNKWSSEDGPIHRSKRFDERNKGNAFIYTSIILDARK
ncbi:methyltransferase domain-containing protein [Patescibacteria group bacterium]|nr:methyltransferase domain-containing protein [Patescibacteria group bacterium]